VVNEEAIKEVVGSFYDGLSQGEPRYTLEEAKQILRESECSTYGHSYDIISTFDGSPAALSCSNGCGKSWKVVDNGV
jgi:hypothetical protein